MRPFRRRTKVISFRLSESDYALIADQSRANGSSSVAEYARLLTCHRLSMDSTNGIPVHFADLNSAAQALSRKLSAICEELLECAEILASVSKEQIPESEQQLEA
jgi:hypothetical protein